MCYERRRAEACVCFITVGPIQSCSWRTCVREGVYYMEIVTGLGFAL